MADGLSPIPGGTERSRAEGRRHVTLFISPEEVDVAREINGGSEIQSFGERGCGLHLDSTSTPLAALRVFGLLRDAKGVRFAGVSASTANDLSWLSPVGLDDQRVRIAQRKDHDGAKRIAVMYILSGEAHQAVETKVNEGAPDLEIFLRAIGRPTGLGTID